MSNFKDFRDLISKRIDYLVSKSETLFLVETDSISDESWNEYMKSFPEGTNEIFRERRHYECNCCRQFIRPYAGLVGIINGKKETIWDVDTEGYFKDVAEYMNSFVLSKPISSVYVTKESKLGVDRSDPAPGERWYHFHYRVPASIRDKSPLSVDSVRGTYSTHYNTFTRALTETNVETLETVLELINNKSVERGDEFKWMVEEFLACKKDYDKLQTEEDKRNYTWSKVVTLNGSLLTIRSSSIGTLIWDILDGKDLEEAVIAHGKKVSGANYKRPKNQIITQKMHDAAVDALKSAGLVDSLSRRYATSLDVDTKNVLYVDESVELKDSLGNEALDMMSREVSHVPPKNIKGSTTMSMEDFLKNVVPTATSLELLVKNEHISNLASLTAGKIEGAKNLFKWGNDKAWTYNKGVADSIKGSVQRLGGKVDAVLRFSIQWFNNDDYDAHCIEPGGNRIYYSSKSNRITSGELDVDIITPEERSYKDIVENIVHTDLRKMEEGEYSYMVHNFNKRGGDRPPGFIAELEYEGKVWRYVYKKDISHKKFVNVVTIKFSKSKGVEIITSLPEDNDPKDVWGIKTNTFNKVSMITNSPNFWKGEAGVGNKHTFFILDGCKNEDTNPRGFYNEFLKEELNPHRKFFEVLGSKVKLEEGPSEQLSGLGFSSSRSGELIFRVKGKFQRTVKVTY